MQIFAPAKINLSLRILARRADGFHEIETFIAPISLADELTLTRSGAGRRIQFNCTDSSIPQGDENLVVQAARKFFEATKIEPEVSIELKKNIPHGAGLGGGSSDAAAVLLGLNRLFDTNLAREALADLAAGIGSDVPFFVFGKPALCRGRGELVGPQELREKFSLLLLKPDFGIPSAWAYRHWQGSLEIPGVAYGFQEFNGHRFVNDLERPAFEKFPFLSRLKNWLLEQPEVAVALMSGSGSTIFAVLQDDAEGDELAKRAKAKLDPRLWTWEGRTC